jgi:hypothetical protein
MGGQQLILIAAAAGDLAWVFIQLGPAILGLARVATVRFPPTAAARATHPHTPATGG